MTSDFNVSGVENTTVTTDLNLDLVSILEELFLVLTVKERDVITQRFSLDNKPKRTLESIGQKFSVTRERIRQIEAKALEKMGDHTDMKKLRDY